MTDKLIFGVDIGGSKVVAIVATVGEEILVTGMSTCYYAANEHDNNQMVSAGVVVDINKVSEHVLHCLHEAKEMADCSYGSVVMNVSGSHVRNVYSIQEYNLNGESFNYDFMNKIIDDAKYQEIPNGFEILDYEVQEYLVNNDFYAKNPVDLACDEVVSHINLFVAKSINLKNLKKLLEKKSHCNVAKIVPSAILSASAVLTYEEKKSGTCVIDIGASTTDVVVYENGYVRELFVLPIGGSAIINDVRTSMKVSREVAEELVYNFGKCGVSLSSTEKVKTLNHKGDYIELSLKRLNDVISHRVRDILLILKEQLVKDGVYDIIESGFVLTGGVALLNGIDKFTAEQFDAQARIGTPIYDGEFEEILQSPRYATAVGLVKLSQEFFDDDVLNSDSGVEFKLVVDKIKNIFKNI